MSTTIDNKVVEMRFDNKQFESATAQSMSTIDKLKQKLNFGNSAKSLDGLNKAAKNVDMSGLGSAVNTVSTKFSALQVAGVTALANITNSAVNAGKRMVSALTIDPIKTGFQEYELKMGSIQTIMASTGESLETVNKYLDELNEYSDKTIYSFQDMTSNIGKFTNAGVKLEDAVLAMKGISNEAAVSGANANEASRAMYNFAQALSAGYVKLIDWKSIELANMATVEFKEQLIATAVSAGTLTKAGDGMYKTLAGNTLSATKNFNETLTDQWMTSEVLIETLKQYADETTDIGKKATKAATEVKTFSQMMDALKESAQSGWAKTWELIFGDFNQGKSLWTSINNVLDGLIGKMTDFRNDLLESALGMGFDKLKGTVNKALGPIEKVMDSAEKVGDSISKVTGSLKDLDAIAGDVIHGDFGNGQERFDKLTKAGYNYCKVQNKVNETLGDGYRYTKEQIEAQDKLLASQTKTTEETKKTEEGVTKLTNAQKTQLKSMLRMSEEQMRNNGYTEEQIKALKELKDVAEQLGLPLNEFVDNLDKINGRWLLLNSFKNIGESLSKIFGSLGNAFKDVFGVIKPESLFDAIAAFHRLTEELVISDKTADNLRSTFRGLFAIVDIISRIFGGGLRLAIMIVSSVLEAFGSTALDATATIGDLIYKFDEWLKKNDFIAKGVQFLADKLPPLVENIKEFVKELYIDSGVAENFHKIADGFKSIWSVLHGKFVYSLNSVLKILGSVLNLFGTNLGELLAKIATYISKAVEWVAENTMIIDSIEKIANIIVLLIDGIGRVAKAFLALEPVQKLIENIKKAFSKLGDIFDFDLNFSGIDGLYKRISEIFSKIEKWIKNLDGSESFQAGLNVVEGVANGIISGFGKAIEAIRSLAQKIINAFCQMLGIHSPSTVMIALGGFIVSGLIIGILRMIPSAWSAITSFIDKIRSAFQNGFEGVVEFFGKVGGKLKTVWESLGEIDWNSLFVAGVIVAVLLLLKKLLDVMDKLASPIADIGGAIKGFFNTVGSSIEKYFKAKTLETKSKAILNIAKAIALLAASFYLLSRLDWPSIGKGAVALAAISGALILLTFAASKMDSVEFGKLGLFMLSFSVSILILSKAMQMLASIYIEDALSAIGSLTLMIAGMGTLLYLFGKLVTNKDVAANMGKAGTMFIKMAIAMMLMAAAIKIMAGISNGDIIKGMAVITGLALLFGAFTVLSAVAKHAKGAGSMMLKMAIAIAIIPIVIRMIADIPNGDIIKGMTVIAGIELLFAGMIAVSYFAGQHASKAGSMLLKMSIAIGILAMTMKLFATMSYGDITKGLICIAGVEALFAAFILVSKLAKNDGNRAGSMILKMAAGMALMGLAIKIIASTSTGDIIKGLAVIAAIEILFGAMVLITKTSGAYADKAGSMMLKMSLAILVLAGAIALLSFLDPKEIAVATAAISALMLSFAAIAFAVSKMGNCMKELIVIAATIALLVGAIIGLTFIDQDKVMTASIALSSVIGMLAILTAATKYAGKVDKSVLILIGVVGALAGILYLLSDLPVESTLSTAASLSILLMSLAAALKIMSTVKSVSKDALIGIAALSGVVAVLAGILGLMAYLKVEASIQTAVAIGILLNTMAAALVILGFVKPTAMTAMPAMYAISGVVAILALILGVMSKLDVEPSIETATALSILLISMSIVTAILAAVGSVAPAAIIGAAAFAGVVTIIGALMVALGALVKYIPSVEEFLDKGISVLEKIGQGIGRFVGGIVSGLADGALSSLPSIGKHLSDFMENAKPFIEGVKLVDDSVMKGVTTLTRSVIALTAANMLENMASFLQLGSSFSSLGTELSKFIINAMPFITTVRTFTPESFEGVKALTEAILTLTAASFIEDITRFIPMSSSLSKFGAELPKLAIGLRGFVDNLGVFTEEQVTSIKCAANAIKALSNAASQLDGQADWAKKLFGDNSLTAFASQLPTTAKALRSFVDNLGTFSEDQVKTVKCAGDAINVMAEAANNIDGQADWAKKLFGDNGLSKFSNELPLTALSLKSFVENLGTFTEDQVASVKCAANAIKVMAQAGSNLDGQAEWAKALFGDNGLGAFSSELPAVAKNLKSFVTNLGTFSEDQVSSVQSAVNVVKAMAKLGDTNLAGLITNLPTFGDKLIAFADDLVSFCDKISKLDTNAAGNITENLVSTVKGMASSISKCNTSMKDAGSKLTTALASGIKNKKTSVNNAAKEVVNGAKKAISNKKEDFKKAGEGFGKSLANGIKAKKDTVKKAGETLCKQAKTGISEYKDDFETAGKDLGKGLVNGINAKKQAAYNAGFALGKKAAQGVKDGSKEQSPSKLTYQYGVWQGEGLINGIVSMIKKAYKTGYNLGETAARSMSDAISKVSDILNTDMETQPTIRPVLDLSDVKSGAGAINGMFGLTPSVGVMADFNSVSAMMNQRNQNGFSNDIVSAIKKLGADLGNLGGTTYNINGVTYDDGSAIQSAFGEVIRQAKIERRT